MLTTTKLRNGRFLIGLSLVLSAAFISGCGLISGESKIDEGIVIVPKLIIRSTTAPAARNLAEVKRGDRLEILEQSQVKTPTRTVEWYKVRTKTKDATEGWVESRSVINKSVVDKTQDLFEKSQATASQGTGRLKVQTRLRIEAGGDVVTYLSRGTLVEIVGKARNSNPKSSRRPTIRTRRPKSLRLERCSGIRCDCPIQKCCARAG